MKIMGIQFDDQGSNKLGFVAGMVGGAIQWMLNIDLPTGFLSKLVEAGITAGVCGLMGVAGKELFIVARRALVSYFKNRKNKNNVGQDQ